MQARPDEGSAEESCPCVPTSAPSVFGEGTECIDRFSPNRWVRCWRETSSATMEAQHASAPEGEKCCSAQKQKWENLSLYFVNNTCRCVCTTRHLICMPVCLPRGVVLKASFICRACACVRMWRTSVVGSLDWFHWTTYSCVRGAVRGSACLKHDQLHLSGSANPTQASFHHGTP